MMKLEMKVSSAGSQIWGKPLLFWCRTEETPAFSSKRYICSSVMMSMRCWVDLGDFGFDWFVSCLFEDCDGWSPAFVARDCWLSLMVGRFELFTFAGPVY